MSPRVSCKENSYCVKTMAMDKPVRDNDHCFGHVSTVDCRNFQHYVRGGGRGGSDDDDDDDDDGLLLFKQYHVSTSNLTDTRPSAIPLNFVRSILIH